MSRVVGILATLLAGTLLGGAFVDRHVNSRLPSSDVEILLTTEDGSPGICSGVYIGHGTVLTAKHCTGDEFKNARVVLDQHGKPGPAIDAFLEWQSPTADIAAYHLTGEINAQSATLSCRAPQIGEPIEVVGNPYGFTFVHTTGVVAGVGRTTDDADEVPISAVITPGNSGGPVYDAYGRILGIITESTNKQARGAVNFMVSGQEACRSGHHF
jgi:S1-C subfamily serine protease